MNRTHNLFRDITGYKYNLLQTNWCDAVLEVLTREFQHFAHVVARVLEKCPSSLTSLACAELQARLRQDF